MSSRESEDVRRSDWPSETWSALSGPTAIALDPNATTFYVANQYANEVTVHALGTGSIQSTISGFQAPLALAVAPDRSQLYVVNGNGSSVSAVKLAVTPLAIATTITTAALPTAVAVSADSARAYVTNGNGFSLSEIDTATNTVTYTVAKIGIYPSSIVLWP